MSNIRRRVLAAAAALTIAVPFAPEPALAGGNVNFVLGARTMRDDAWGDLQDQGAFGVAVDFSPEDWPIHFVFGAQVSAQEDDDEEFFFFEDSLTGVVGELSFGAVFLPNTNTTTRPYIGAGLVRTATAIDLDGEFGEDEDEDRDSDNSWGYYANAGVYWRLGTRFNIGIDGRLVRGTDEVVFGQRRSAQYGQIGLLLGFGF